MIKVLIVLSVIALIGGVASAHEPVIDETPPPLTGTLLEALKNEAPNEIILRHIAAGKGINDKNEESDDGQFDYGFTPLHYAAMERDHLVINALLEAGADIEAVDGFGYPAHIYILLNNEMVAATSAAFFRRTGGKNRAFYNRFYGLSPRTK